MLNMNESGSNLVLDSRNVTWNVNDIVSTSNN